MPAQNAPRPTPENIFNALKAYQNSAALKAGIELDVFTAIADGSNDLAALAKKLGAAERGVRILCDSLTVLGFLTKEDGRYSLTEESAIFLNRRSPAYVGAMANFMHSDALVENFAGLAEAVKKGGTVSAQGDNEQPHDEIWVNFARSMAALSFPGAAFIAQLTGMAESKPCEVLDIAAGHGMYGITMARQNANAHVTALDWEKVLEVAQENARAAGVAERFAVRPGSAFTADLGEGYDYVLLTNIFHHFDPSTCEKLMTRVHAALKPGGKAVTLEFVPNEDRVSPSTAAMFSLVMLAMTDQGDAYTFSEYQRMFGNAGFKRTTLHPVPDMPQQVLVSEK
jgi:2-polyprenyl-3-methyl-5-hydroxy-6-metoxy-1,4-benzoquinol methylase